MKKRLAIGLSLTLTLGLLVSCGGNGTATAPGGSAAPSQSAAPTVPSLSGKVSTNGSTSMEKVMGALIESFAEVEGEITVTYDPTGSGSGIQAAANGSADIGLSSRGLKESEKAKGLTETVVAKDGIAIVVNKENAVDDLTVEQIAAIAKGEITNWQELGGSDAEIAFIGREAGSGTRGAFEEMTGTRDVCAYHQELTSTGAVITAVSTTPGAMGYASLSSVENTVKVLKVGGVVCTEETVLDGSYAIQRPLVFATKSGQPLSPTAQAFFDYATDPASAGLYTAAGVVPVFR